MSLLDEILGLEPEEIEEEPIEYPKKIAIGRGALDKAYAVCDAAKQVHGSGVEWYGVMLGSRSEPSVVRDIAIGSQESSAGHTGIDGAEFSSLMADVRGSHPDKTVNGWIHSHGSIPGELFFSYIDKENMETVLNTVWLNTARRFMQAHRIVEGEKEVRYDAGRGEIVIAGNQLTDGEIRIKADGPANGMKAYSRQPALAGYSFSVVVNDERGRKGAISVITKYPLTGREEAAAHDADVEVLGSGEFALDINEGAILEEVRAKVRPPRYALHAFGRHYGYGFWDKSRNIYNARGSRRRRKRGWRQDTYKPRLYEPLAAQHEFQYNPQPGAAEFLAAALSYRGEESEALCRIVEKAVSEGKAAADVSGASVGAPSALTAMRDAAASIDAYARMNEKFSRFMGDFVRFPTFRKIDIARYAKEGI